ncbi:MAG: DNA polymerase Y family protein [Deltaproteobacteria bacterium]
MATILHIDMDAFFASVEQQVNPALRGRPVIVGSRDKKYRTVVAAASYEAKAYGIDSGMPTWQAFKLCPHAAFVACDSARYTYVSREIRGLLEPFSPDIQHTTIDEFDLVVDGLERHFGPPPDLGRTIKKIIRETFGLACTIGIAPTWILAKLACKLHKPDGLFWITETNLDEVIKGVPVAKICGIGPALTRYLETLGIATCDQLKQTPQNVLTDHFGRATGHWLFQSLRTDENLTFQKGETGPGEGPRSVGHSYTLPSAVSDPKTIESWLRMLCEMVAERTRKYGLVGRTTGLWLSFENESFFRQKTHPIPTHDGWELFSRARAIYAQKKACFRAVRALGVHLTGLEKDQTPPLLPSQKKREEVLAAMDRVNSRFGDWTLYPATLKNISSK